MLMQIFIRTSCFCISSAWWCLLYKQRTRGAQNAHEGRAQRTLLLISMPYAHLPWLSSQQKWLQTALMLAPSFSGLLIESLLSRKRGVASNAERLIRGTSLILSAPVSCQASAKNPGFKVACMDDWILMSQHKEVELSGLRSLPCI